VTSIVATKLAQGRGGHIRRNIIVSYLGQALSILTPLILIPLFTRLLGHETYGQWLMLQSIAGYLGIGAMGTWQAIGNRIAEDVAMGRWEELGDEISTAFFGYAILAAILFAVSAAVAPWIFASVSREGDAHVALAFSILAALMLASWPFRTNAMVLRGLEQVDKEQAIVAISSLFRVVGIATILYAGFKLIGVALVQGGSVLAYGLGSYIVSLRFMREARPRWSRFSSRVVRSLAKPSFSFFLMDASHTLNFSVENVVIGYVLGTAMVTAYAVPYRMLTAIATLFTVLLSALRPTLTVRFARQEHALLYSALLLLVRLALLYASLVAFVAWLLGPEILKIWAGAGVFPGKGVFAMQIVVFVMGVLVEPCLAMLMATTHHYGYAKMIVVEALLNLSLSLWWVHVWGLAGVIGGTLVARVVTALWYAPAAAFSMLGVNFKTFIRDTAPALLVCLGTIGAAIVVDYTTKGGMLFLLPATVAGSIIIVAAFAFAVFSAPERQAAWQFIFKRVAKSAPRADPAV
jgi:O-antigen/teichoic acid export membrane protein